MLRVLGYLWALPNTLVGLLFVPAALLSAVTCRSTGPHRAGGLQIVDGVLELHGPCIAAILRRAVPIPGGAAAVTLGHVVLARDPRSLVETRRHERVHVRQCERWGPVFIPAYLLASAWSWLEGRGAYQGNLFEREARAVCARGARMRGTSDSLDANARVIPR